MDEQWYALHVRFRFERFVQSQLAEKGYETFFPTYVVASRRFGFERSLTLPLFPGYVFARFDVHTRPRILLTPGVNLIAGAGNAPAAADRQEFLTIRRLVESGVAIQPWPYLQEGPVVRVESGPLKGLSGLLVRNEDSDRLVVSVTILMRSVSFEIDQNVVLSIGTNSSFPERQMTEGIHD